MKKFSLLVMLIVSITPLGFCFGQNSINNFDETYLYPNPSLILKIMTRSESLNPQIKNRDVIFPGWVLFYKIYEELPPVAFRVKTGDCQTKILSRYQMSKSDILINDLVKESSKRKSVKDFTTSLTEEKLELQSIKVSGFTFSPFELRILALIFSFVIICVFILGYMFFNKKKYPEKKRKEI